jgi:hypothetical protein
VTADKLASDAVTTAKILNSQVTTAKLADGAVTTAKLATSNYQLSSTSGSLSSHTTTSFTDMTNLSVTITTSGRPVYLAVVSDGSGSFSELYATAGAASVNGIVQIIRGATSVFARAQTCTAAGAATIRCPLSLPYQMDFPAAGTYTYKFQARVGSASSSDQVNGAFLKLLAIEL